MFCMLPCPTILDQTPIQSTQFPKSNDTRQLLKKFSNTETLISQVQQGEVIMKYKFAFDEYLKSQVDLMKAYVGKGLKAQFKYKGFFSDNTIDTASYGPKEQWGFEIVMSRYILSSVYIAGALQSIGKLFQQTPKSHIQGYQNTGQFSKHLQIMFKYFSQGIDPLRRLCSVMDSVTLLFPQQLIPLYPEINPQLFKLFTELIMSNLAYLKIEKYRILKEYRSCKEGAWAVYEKMKELKVRLGKFTEYKPMEELNKFVNLGIVFYKCYALNFLLLQNQQKKTGQEYGFIKKQFQQMVNENLVVADQILKIQAIAKKLPGQQDDNVIFANSVIDLFAEHAKSIKYKFEIQLHQTKMQRPSLQQIVAQIDNRNIWDALNQF